jgi:tripartite-type tricarboxylate transporter receptor subunit TctC
VKDLLAYAKANPGKLNFGSAGIGGLGHLGMELFKYTAKIDINHVPYKGTSQAMSDLAGGEIQAMFSSMASMKGMIDKKLITPIGMTAASDSASFKGVPVIAKAGVPGFEYATWYGVFATNGTPTPVIERLSAALTKMGADKGLRARLDAQGADLHISSAKELTERTRTETVQWDRTIRDAKIELTQE